MTPKKSMEIEKDLHNYIFNQQVGTDKNVSNTLRRLLRLPNSKGKTKTKQSKKTKGQRIKRFSRRKHKQTQATHSFLSRNKLAPLFRLNNNQDFDENYESDFEEVGVRGKGGKKA